MWTASSHVLLVRSRHMTLTAAQVLKLLSATGSHLVRESAHPRFARDAWVVKSADGNDLEIELGGYAFHPVRVPDSLFADLEGAQRIALDGQDGEGNPVYRLSEATETRTAA